jgi:hypothetical protein
MLTLEMRVHLSSALGSWVALYLCPGAAGRVV